MSGGKVSTNAILQHDVRPKNATPRNCANISREDKNRMRKVKASLCWMYSPGFLHWPNGPAAPRTCGIQHGIHSSHPVGSEVQIQPSYIRVGAQSVPLNQRLCCAQCQNGLKYSSRVTLIYCRLTKWTHGFVQISSSLLLSPSNQQENYPCLVVVSWKLSQGMRKFSQKHDLFPGVSIHQPII